MSEQPRPTEEMNGVLHEDELPPQVIKRCEKGHVSILQVILYKMCTCCMLFLYSVEFVRIVEKWPVNFSFQLATFKNVEQDKASSPKIKCSFIKCNKKKIIVCWNHYSKQYFSFSFVQINFSSSKSVMVYKSSKHKTNSKINREVISC